MPSRNHFYTHSTRAVPNSINPINSISPINPFTLVLSLLPVLTFSHAVLGATASLLPIADTSLMESFPTNNLGGENVILAGVGENLKRHRALLRFDAAGQLPAGAKIQSASLTLELAWLPANGYSPSTMELHRLFRSWGEGNKQSPTNCTSCAGQGALAGTNEACWLTPFAWTTNAWTSPGAAATNDFVSDISASQTIYKFADSPYTFGPSPAMGADVQAWLDNPQANFGWILLGQDETVKFSARRFWSRENTNFPPYLTVQYLVAPLIDRVQRTGRQLNLFFTAQPEQSYVVEFRDGLTGGTWQTLANLGYFSETTRVLIVDPITAAQRFYRVVTY
ncbi:MAG: hypothetical protein DME25_06165 [Verrucomicrobia bacterium]|nr:MAG: hypothetical protein DME25_06165 [Verrucomicrobiota bacterium]